MPEKIPKKIRPLVYNKYNGRCAYCGEEILFNEMQVDHIIPKSIFITRIEIKHKLPGFLKHLTVNDLNHFDNLNPSCRSCNKHKDTLSLESYRREISMMLERARRTSFNYRIALKYGQVKETPTDIIFYFEKFIK